eukprot:jgi/Bigna1/68918/fgenesh1_pg.7_\
MSASGEVAKGEPEKKEGEIEPFEFEDELYEENPFTEQWDPSIFCDISYLNFQMWYVTARYTEENKTKRKSLRNDPNVRKSIQKFWKLLEMNNEGKLTKKGYEELFVRICKVIRPNFELKQAKKAVSDDFERDAQGADSLSYEVFFESMFELVDLWTVDIDASEYENFLDKVFMRMTILTRTNSLTGETMAMSPKSQVANKRREEARNKKPLPQPRIVTKKKPEKAVEKNKKTEEVLSKEAKEEKGKKVGGTKDESKEEVKTEAKIGAADGEATKSGDETVKKQMDENKEEVKKEEVGEEEVKKEEVKKEEVKEEEAKKEEAKEEEAKKEKVKEEEVKKEEVKEEEVKKEEAKEKEVKKEEVEAKKEEAKKEDEEVKKEEEEVKKEDEEVKKEEEEVKKEEEEVKKEEEEVKKEEEEVKKEEEEVKKEEEEVKKEEEEAKKEEEEVKKEEEETKKEEEETKKEEVEKQEVKEREEVKKEEEETKKEEEVKTEVKEEEEVKKEEDVEEKVEKQKKEEEEKKDEIGKEESKVELKKEEEEEVKTEEVKKEDIDSTAEKAKKEAKEAGTSDEATITEAKKEAKKEETKKEEVKAVKTDGVKTNEENEDEGEGAKEKKEKKVVEEKGEKSHIIVTHKIAPLDDVIHLEDEGKKSGREGEEKEISVFEKKKQGSGESSSSKPVEKRPQQPHMSTGLKKSGTWGSMLDLNSIARPTFETDLVVSDDAEEAKNQDINKFGLVHYREKAVVGGGEVRASHPMSLAIVGTPGLGIDSLANEVASELALERINLAKLKAHAEEMKDSHPELKKAMEGIEADPLGNGQHLSTVLASLRKVSQAVQYRGYLIDSAALPISALEAPLLGSMGDGDSGNNDPVEFVVVLPARKGTELEEKAGWTAKAEEEFTRALKHLYPKLEEQYAQRKLKLLSMEPVGLPTDQSAVIDAINELVGFCRFREAVTVRPIASIAKAEKEGVGDADDAGKDGKKEDVTDTTLTSSEEEGETAKKLTKALFTALGYNPTGHGGDSNGDNSAVGNENSKEKSISTDLLEQNLDVELRFGAWGQFCPVTLKEKGILVKGDAKRYAAAFNGTLYAMVGEKERIKFVNNPTRYITASGPSLPKKGYVVALASSSEAQQEEVKKHADLAAKEYGWKSYNSIEEAAKEAEKEGDHSQISSGVIVIEGKEGVEALSAKGVVPSIVVALEERKEKKKKEDAEAGEGADLLSNAVRAAGTKFAKVIVQKQKEEESSKGKEQAFEVAHKEILINLDPLLRRAIGSKQPEVAVQNRDSSSDSSSSSSSLIKALGFGGRAYCPVALIERKALVPGAGAGGSSEDGESKGGKLADVEAGGVVYSCADKESAEKLRSDPGKFELERDPTIGFNFEDPRVLVVGPPGAGKRTVADGMARELTHLGVEDIEVKSIKKLLLKPLRERVRADLQKHLSDGKKERAKLLAFCEEKSNLNDDVLESIDEAYKTINGEEENGGSMSFADALTKSMKVVRQNLGQQRKGWIAALDVYHPGAEKAIRNGLLGGKEAGIPHLIININCSKDASQERFLRYEGTEIEKKVTKTIEMLSVQHDVAVQEARDKQRAKGTVTKEDVEEVFKKNGIAVMTEEKCEELAKIISVDPKDEAVETRRERLEKEHSCFKDVMSELRVAEEKKMEEELKKESVKLFAAADILLPKLVAPISRYPKLPETLDGTMPDAMLTMKGMNIARELMRARRAGFSPPQPVTSGDAMALLRLGVKKLTKKFGTRCPVGTTEGPTTSLPARPSTHSSSHKNKGATQHLATTTQESFPVAWRRYIVFCGSDHARRKFMENVQLYLSPPARPNNFTKKDAMPPAATGSAEKGDDVASGDDTKEEDREGKLLQKSAADSAKKGDDVASADETKEENSKPDATTTTKSGKNSIEVGLGSKSRNEVVEKMASTRVPHKVCVLGGPRSGRARVAEDLQNALGLELFSRRSMLASLVNGECGKGFQHLEAKAKATLESDNTNGAAEREGSSKNINDEEMTEIVKHFIQRPKSRLRGWVLEGYPETLGEAKGMKAHSIVPYQVFQLGGEKKQLLGRILDDKDKKLSSSEKKKEGGEEQANEISRLNKYFKHNMDVQIHFQCTYDNLHCLNSKLTPWRMSRKVIDSVHDSMNRRRAFHASWRAGRPARLYGMAVTQEQLQTRLNKAYGWYCPVSWIEEQALRKRVYDYRFMALFKGGVFCLADEAKLAMFEKNPEKYAQKEGKGLPSDLPIRLDYIHAHVLKAKDCVLRGKDPVDTKKIQDTNVKNVVPADGRESLVVKYKGRHYRFKDEQNLEEFMIFPRKYENVALPSLEDMLKDLLGSLGKTMAEPLIDAMTHLGKKRPIYPSAKAPESAALFVALHLKAFNAKKGDEELKICKNGLNEFIKACSVATKLSKAYNQKDEEEATFLAKLYDFYALAAPKT